MNTRTLALVVFGAGVLAAGGAVLLTTQRGQAPGSAPRPSCPAGAVPINLIAQGPGMVSGCGGSTRSSTTVCPQLGEACAYTAWPDGGATFRGWQGPGGITATARTISPPAETPGFVRALFDPPPGVISTGPNGQIGFNPPSIPVPGVHFQWVWDHINIAGHWFSVPDIQF